jgi:hypothetical protein
VCVAERVGFEPTWELPPNPLSRRARYDHFGTSPVNDINAELTTDTSQPAVSIQPLPVAGFSFDNAQRLARRDALHQADPILGMLERLHLWELGEEPAPEGFPGALGYRHHDRRIGRIV